MAAFMGVDAALFPATEPVFLLSGFLTGTVGLFLVLANAGARPIITRHDAFMLTATMWLTAGLGRGGAAVELVVISAGPMPCSSRCPGSPPPARR